MRFLFSESPKCETVLGLAKVTDARGDAPGAPQTLRASTSLHMPPDLMVMRFLSAFRSVFPQACALIYGHLFDQMGMMTAQAEQTIRAAAARHFSAGAAPEAALCACALELRQIAEHEFPG
jgi:hypothetical protein